MPHPSNSPLAPIPKIRMCLNREVFTGTLCAREKGHDGLHGNGTMTWGPRKHDRGKAKGSMTPERPPLTETPMPDAPNDSPIPVPGEWTCVGIADGIAWFECELAAFQFPADADVLGKFKVGELYRLALTPMYVTVATSDEPTE